MGRRPRDRSGERYGKLVIISRHSYDGKHVRWNCRCDCGSKRAYTFQQIKNQQRCSCGRDPSKWMTKHGRSDSKLYSTYYNMKARCKNDPSYCRISVCERWENSFEAFAGDMGDPPGPEWTIDRIDNDGDYSPENCRWATRKMQANNRSASLIEFRGVTKSREDWCREFGINKRTFRARLAAGWSVERALTQPARR